MHQNIVDKLKESYSRKLRKEIVNNILKYENNNDKQAQESSYKILNQIFSYIISELGWNISKSTSSWDDAPLKIVCEVFPKIEKTKWYEMQHINVKKPIELKGDIK